MDQAQVGGEEPVGACCDADGLVDVEVERACEGSEESVQS